MLDRTLVPQDCLRAGDWAEIVEVTGDPEWVARLAELGIRVGSRLQVLQAGSPCFIQIGGSRLSLRADLAVQILVPLNAAPGLSPPKSTARPATG